MREFIGDRHAADGHAHFAENTLRREHMPHAAEKLFHAVADRAPDKNHIHFFSERRLADFLDGDVRREQDALIAQCLELALDELEAGVMNRIEWCEENFHVFQPGIISPGLFM